MNHPDAHIIQMRFSSITGKILNSEDQTEHEHKHHLGLPNRDRRCEGLPGERFGSQDLFRGTNRNEWERWRRNTEHEGTVAEETSSEYSTYVLSVKGLAGSGAGAKCGCLSGVCGQ
jgi:hypothetical protein